MIAVNKVRIVDNQLPVLQVLLKRLRLRLRRKVIVWLVAVLGEAKKVIVEGERWIKANFSPVPLALSHPTAKRLLITEVIEKLTGCNTRPGNPGRPAGKQ